MQSSLPSKRVAVLDVPEVKNFEAEFRYNFFSPDERTNDTGIAPNNLLLKPAETLGNNYVESLDYNRFTPRYNKLTWKPVNVGNRPDISLGVSVEKNYSKLYTEEKFAGSNDFSSLTFQDTQIDGKMAFYVRKAIESFSKGTKAGSPLDLAKQLNQQTSSDVSSNFLANALYNPNELGVSFENGSTNNTRTASVLADLKKLKLDVKVNNMLLAKTLNTIKEDVITPFADEIEPLLKTAQAVEQQTQTTQNSSVFSGDDYDLEISNYITIKTVDSSGYDNVVQSVGYVIERSEVLPNGSTFALPPIFVENPNIGSIADSKVKYGTTYVYRIRSVAYIETQAQDMDSNNVVAVGFIASSLASNAHVVLCQDFTAPPPPSDFNVSWDQKNQCGRLMWSFPPNTQRDIKKFQVFRRKSIREPYQLIKMFDFDDSYIKSPYAETPDPSLVETIVSPKMFYLDQELNKNTRYIYTLCSIDAHGLSSNYSMQLEASFDKIGNKLIKRMVSVAGAPKAYPNVYLNSDTFVDSIKDEGHTKVRVVFNPEFLKVVDNAGHDLGLLKTGQTDTYRLQLINVDLQKQQVVELHLNADSNDVLKTS